MSTANEIIRVFCDIDDFKTMKKFFEEIFTSAEVQDVALRWRLMQLLHNEIPQRQIASKLGISLCKITRGSKVLKARAGVSKKILDRKSGGNKNAVIPATKTGTQP